MSNSLKQAGTLNLSKSRYVARDKVSPGGTPDAYESFHVTNVVVPPMVRGYEKDELQ